MDFPIVGLGASAGGLEACRKLLDALPNQTGMAFILVQHLDPTHESMMVDLLAGHTMMKVCQVTDGMPIEAEHLYVIPPGTYLSVAGGALHLSEPGARHGARLPFDFLLHSLAEAKGAGAMCVILSGTGTDGSLGVQAIARQGGLVVVQKPEEAGFDGMPRNAMLTGAVDLILPVAEIPAALLHHAQKIAPQTPKSAAGPVASDADADWLPAIIKLVREHTVHDFTLYKKDTLRRRIQRRMALTSVQPNDMAHYFEGLRVDPKELELLARDLLINVTSFFRDEAVFAVLTETVIPEIIRTHEQDQPLRIWIAGCSTGEETYSLTIIFSEAIAAAKRNIKLQVFASDVDPDAVAQAREGFYQPGITTQVSPERLAKFFTKEDHGYRVTADLRAAVVFTVQDLLADPPFSRLDFVSCRNLLIYLQPEAQAKVLSAFHFGLRQGGILLLGNAETVGNDHGRFEVISKTARLYRHVGRSRPGEFGLSKSFTESMRQLSRPGLPLVATRQSSLAELCRRLVLEAYSPAAILINQKNECLYSLGPTDRYLRVAPGQPTHDLFSMARPGMRAKLGTAIQQASQTNTRVIVTGDGFGKEEDASAFNIDVQPVPYEGEKLLLICFIDGPKRDPQSRAAAPGDDIPRIAALGQELEATRLELRAAQRDLEIAREEQTTISGEASSINEEFQSTNEELLTSKEELQSLNEELTALNTQLQETLERQRTTSTDLQNVLYSTDVATLFLDTKLNIRFFTPSTRLLFSIISSDVGRPLADLKPIAGDETLLTNARIVLKIGVPLEHEIQTPDGAWYARRILPYRARDGGIEGVVITFATITERRKAADSLEAAKHQAELATAAKSRFLAAASHDLRQPLQTLALVQGLLAKNVQGDKAQQLVARLDKTVGAMSTMLNTLLDINQIEAGIVAPKIVNFSIGTVLQRLQDEFTYLAQAKDIALRVVDCGITVQSDPDMLEQMLRNILSNALKYTNQGKVLLGCRRHGAMLSVEIWDTGIGIPEEEFSSIFEEYHQLGNGLRERRRGLGLGLSIVRRLSDLLGHKISVRSRIGTGSVFSVDVTAPIQAVAVLPGARTVDRIAATRSKGTGTILIIEDDPEVADLLKSAITDEGHQAITAGDGDAALALMARGNFQPDLILTDYNLPKSMTGLQIAERIRQTLSKPTPIIILTGDISTDALREIANHDCLQLNKPVMLDELMLVIQRLLAEPSALAHKPPPKPAAARDPAMTSTIFVVDDDANVRDALRAVFEDDGRHVETFPTAEAFLADHRTSPGACLLVDASLPGLSGLELLQRLADMGSGLPAIMITGHGDVQMAVQAMKAGALDFIEKPVDITELLASVARALNQARDADTLSAWHETAIQQVAGLTARQREIMDKVLAGQPSKNIAADLGISRRTVENHRAEIMKRTKVKSLPALARLALAAAGGIEK